ncbi:hypothetical protein NKH94_15580 [Mesorhizobium australicum]|uniref:hypothetical protein n=1 Tax=Mesorhizobium australicum TaxID=536018 RepID=UPI003339CE50
MSKPFDLERDGLDQWLGLTHKEIAKRRRKLLEARQHDPEYEGMFHEGMHADLDEKKIKLAGGRPLGPAAPNVRLDSAVEEYWRRAEKDRADGTLYGNAEDLKRSVAAEFGVGYEHLKYRLGRGQKRKKL